MNQSAPDLRRPRRAFRRYGIFVGAAVAASLLAGVAVAALSPMTATSTALVALPVSTPTTPALVAAADSDTVLAGALSSLSPGASLATLRGEVKVTSSAPYVLRVSAHAGSAAQAEAAANAVAESIIAFPQVSSANPGGQLPAMLLQPATSASGAASLVRLLIGAMLGVASGVLIGVIASVVHRRVTP